LKERQHKLTGILNGIDTVSYNPERTRPSMRTSGRIRWKKKTVNKIELQKAMGLSQNKDIMLVGIVSRFAHIRE
jgi:starch synthase